MAPSVPAANFPPLYGRADATVFVRSKDTCFDSFISCKRLTADWLLIGRQNITAKTQATGKIQTQHNSTFIDFISARAKNTTVQESE